MPAVVLVAIRFFRALLSGLKDPEFRALFVVTLITVGAGTWFYHVQEGWSWLDSLYFTVITLTTVGYGDFSPVTPGGKIFTIVYILLGLGIISSFIILLAERQRDTRPGLRRVLDVSKGRKSARDEHDSQE